MNRYRFILLPLAVAGIIVLTTGLFGLPKLRTVFQLKAQLNQEKEKLARLTQKDSFLETLDRQVLEQKVEMVEKALPSKKAVAEIIAALAYASREVGVAFIDFQMTPGEMIPEKEESVNFQAVVRGPIDKIESFLAKTNRVLPIMRVVGFKIKGEKAAIEIESYFSSLPKSLGKIDEPVAEISRQETEVYQTISQLVTFEKSVPFVPTGKEDIFSGL